MTTINEIEKIAIEYDAINVSRNDSEASLIKIMNNIIFDNDKNREMTASELVQFFNSGIAPKLNKLIDSENYKHLSRLVNIICKKPLLGDDPGLLQVLNQLHYSNRMSDQFIHDFLTYHDPAAFAIACKVINVDTNTGMLVALYNSKSKNVVASAEAYNEALKTGLLDTQEQALWILQHNQPEELVEALYEINKINYHNRINLTNQKNYLCKCDHPLQLCQAFIQINKGNINLSGLQQEKLSKLDDPLNIAALIIRSRALNNVFDYFKIIDDILSHSNAKEFIEALEYLESRRISLQHKEGMYQEILKSTSPLSMAHDYAALEEILMKTSPSLSHVSTFIMDVSKLHAPAKNEKINQPSFLPDEYNQRDVLSLQEVSAWTSRTEQVNLEHNRILQPGFLNRDPASFLDDVKLTGSKWLTDVCCPGTHAAMLLHIGKELIVNYKVKEDDLNIAAHDVYRNILKDNHLVFPILEDDIKNKCNNIMTQQNWHNDLEKMALSLLSNNDVHEPDKKQIEAAKRLVIDSVRRKVTNEVIADYVKKFLTQHADELNIQAKPMNDMDKPEDYCFLGAAGSGKSTISKKYFNDDKKSEYIVVALDNYRCFTMPDTDTHEEKNTKDVFTRTQDIAYLVKELVQKEIDLQIELHHGRPNVIFDGITLDNQMRKWLSQGNVTSVVAAYRGEPGYIGIAERADTRARDPNASPADKGRFVQTSALLKGHALASQYLLSSIPQHAITTVYDTAIERGQTAVEIAKINTNTHVIEIYDLRVMSEFLNKRNININAVNQIDLILKQNDSNWLVTHPDNKALSVLSLALESRQPYAIKLMNNDIAYAELSSDNGKIKLNILDEKVFQAKLGGNTIEASVLQSIRRQVLSGSLNDQTASAKQQINNNDKREKIEAPQGASKPHMQ